jgi:hypothetical protein
VWVQNDRRASGKNLYSGFANHPVGFPPRVGRFVMALARFFRKSALPTTSGLTPQAGKPGKSLHLFLGGG